MKRLVEGIDAVIDAGRADISVSGELLGALESLLNSPAASKTATSEQVSTIVDLYALRYGRDFKAMIEMARRIEQKCATKRFSRAVIIEIERRAANAN